MVTGVVAGRVVADKLLRAVCRGTMADVLIVWTVIDDFRNLRQPVLFMFFFSEIKSNRWGI